MREVGEWINQNSQPGDVIVNSYPPLLAYYGERDSIDFPPTENSFDGILIDNPDLKYFILFADHYNPDNWAYSYPEKNKLRPAQVFQMPNGENYAIVYLIESRNI